MIYTFLCDRPSSGLVAVMQAVRARGCTVRRWRGEIPQRLTKGRRLFINWGCSTIPSGIPAGNVLNHPHAVWKAIDKREFFGAVDQELPGNNIMPPWFTRWETAKEYLTQHPVRLYCRTLTRASGGRGMYIVTRDDDPVWKQEVTGTLETVLKVSEVPEDHPLVSANLFTAGMIGTRQEWRVYVMAGHAYCAQQKLRRSGIPTTTLIRNSASGWVFSGDRIEDCPRSVQDACVSVVGALGLDFGAVDVVLYASDEKVAVIEVNTAPGFDTTSTSLQLFADQQTGL